MTNDEKAKAYDMALEAARKELGCDRKEYRVVERVLKSIFSELRESEDERMYKAVRSIISQHYDRLMSYQISRERKAEFGEERDKVLAYLEKQKYDRMKPIYDARESFESALEKAWNDYHNGYENVDKLEDDYVECAHAKGFREGYLFGIEKQKEQKPLSTEDMPYVTDEHFFEREQADSFKYRLAEYMTKNCKKEESPYGYTYKINSETILEMAKEELIKRGELQKPVEWSEEDEKIIQSLIREIDKYVFFAGIEANKIVYFLKSLRPSWKPSEEQMEALEFFLDFHRPQRNAGTTNWREYDAVESLYKQLKKL